MSSTSSPGSPAAIGRSPARSELAELKGDQVLPRVTVAAAARSRAELLLRRAHRVERGGRRREQRVERAERVEDAEMRGRIEQRLVLVLAVQLDQAGRQVLQRAGGGEGAVDEARGSGPAT